MNKWMIWRYPHKMETSICPYMSHEFKLEMVIPTMRTPGSEFGSTTTYQRCFGFWNQRSIPWISSYPTVFSQHFRISMWKCWENTGKMLGKWEYHGNIMISLCSDDIPIPKNHLVSFKHIVEELHCLRNGLISNHQWAGFTDCLGQNCG